MNNTGFAQSGGGALPATHWKVQFQGDITLDSLTSYIHHHTDIRFSFNSRKIKGTRTVAFQKDAYGLAGLLQHIRKSTGLYYFSYGRHIIFQDNPPSHPQASGNHTKPSDPRSIPSDLHQAGHATAAHLSGRYPADLHQAGHPTALHPAIPHPVNLHPADLHSPPSASELSVFAHTPPPTKAPVLPVVSLVGHLYSLSSATKAALTTPKATPSTPKAAPASTKAPSAIDWHLQTGLFASETIYVNPAIEAGINPIHLLLSWGSNFHVNGWRIGLGSIIANKPDQQWQVMATFCPLTTTYNIDSGSSALPFTVKGQLYNAGLNWCKRIGNTHWLFKIGASLNLLHTVYYKDGVPTAPARYFTSAENPDTKLYLVHPPWMISNTYNKNATDNNKIWLGLSVGFYYDLKFL